MCFIWVVVVKRDALFFLFFSSLSEFVVASAMASIFSVILSCLFQNQLQHVVSFFFIMRWGRIRCLIAILCIPKLVSLIILPMVSLTNVFVRLIPVWGGWGGGGGHKLHKIWASWYHPLLILKNSALLALQGSHLALQHSFLALLDSLLAFQRSFQHWFQVKRHDLFFLWLYLAKEQTLERELVT